MHALLAIAVAFWGSTAAYAHHGVHTFGSIKLGAPSPVQPGDPTAYPHRVVPRSRFYIFVVAKGIPTMCTFEDCGKEGAVVEKLGGWITGDDQLETIGVVGLDEVEVKKGRQSVIVVSNDSAVVVAIYPNSRMRDLPAILERHRALWKRNAKQGPSKSAN